MVEKRFDLLTVENFNNVVGRCRELISASKFDEIEKEFGYPTSAIWDNSGNFLKPDGNGEDVLDILCFYMSEYSNKEAYLYLMGDIDGEDGAILGYYVSDVYNDIIEIGNFKSVEELVSQINKEYEALKYFNILFNKIEEVKPKIYSELYDLEKLYSVDIDVDYLFENLDVFLESYVNPNCRLSSVYKAKQITKKLEQLVKNNLE